MSERFDYVKQPFIEADGDTIKFTIQNGPVRDNGVNGCQVDDLITVVTKIIRKLNADYPCRENSIVITNLETATLWLGKRKEDREARNVEGTNQK